MFFDQLHFMDILGWQSLLASATNPDGHSQVKVPLLHTWLAPKQGPNSHPNLKGKMLFIP